MNTDDTPSFLFSALDFLVGGSIGFVAAHFAIRRLYSSIRVD
jgi:transmembrane 9 superfamily protein 2/4